MEMEYYTLQFGHAVDSKSEDTGGAPDKVTRDDATIIGDKLFIIPPFDSNAGVLEGWLKNVADLPKDVKPKFQDNLMIGEHHQATAVDLIHAGGDGGELEAAEAEKEEEGLRRQLMTMTLSLRRILSFVNPQSYWTTGVTF